MMIQVDLGEPTRVESLDVQGAGQRGDMYVEEFYLGYSNNAMHWHFYRDGEQFKV